MPPKKQTDTESKTFRVYPHAYDDPRSLDPNAPGLLVETDDKIKIGKAKVITRAQLEQEKDKFAESGLRENEGEAALYGITFDDSKYDYMQHLKPIGEVKDAYFIGADGKISDSYIPPQAKNKLTMSDLLANSDDQLKPRTFKEHYQSQLPVQDSIKGFQPNMDPQLAEVLEALDDDAYVEGEDVDIFDELVKTGEVADESEWKKLNKEPEQKIEKREDEEDWEFAFRKFKLDENKAGSEEDLDSDQLSFVSSSPGVDFGSPVGSTNGSDYGSEARDTVGALHTPKPKTGKKKKRIGAKTDLTGFSMSSSANYRNEGLQLLDDTFEKVEEEYLKDSESEEESEFDMSKERSDLNSIMDEFLSDFVVEGKHLYKRSK